MINMEKKYKKELKFQTRAVHFDNGIDKETNVIKRPIIMGNSYKLPYDPNLNWSSADTNLYTRNGGSNQQYLQERIRSLENGEDSVVLVSGVAALSGLFFALLMIQMFRFHDKARSNRSRFMTLFHTIIKSCRNFSVESSHA
jgi:cystathionine beta-lyase/cystathionine gamma-synthase